MKYEFDAIKNEMLSENPLQEIIYARAAVIAAVISKKAEKYFQSTKIHQTNPKLSDFNRLIDIHFKEEKSVTFFSFLLNILKKEGL